MHLALPTTLVISALLGLGQAVPAASPAELVPRACVTEYPTLITHIFEASPDQKSPNNNYIEVAHDYATRSPALYRRDVVVQFSNIPSGSFGCQLEAFFPAGTPISSYGDPRVNVFAVDKPATPDDTWNTSPKPTFLFGTVAFESKPNEDVRRVINSATCQSTLTYRLSTATDQLGEVYFTQGSSQGLRLVHNC